MAEGMRRYIAPWTGPRHHDSGDLVAGTLLAIREFPDDAAAIRFLVEQRANIMRGRTVVLIDVTNVHNPGTAIEGFRVVATYTFDS